MNGSSDRLSGWPLSWSKYKNLYPHDTTFPMWARFASRSRAASCFKSAQFEKLKKVTAEGYTSGIALILAYSALDIAHQANGTKIGHAPILDDDLAPRLREAFKTFPLMDALDNARLRNKLQCFMESDANDIQPICSAFRHLLAHGHFTPWGAEVYTKIQRACLMAIRDRLLAEGEKLLNGHVSKLMASRG